MSEQMSEIQPPLYDLGDVVAVQTDEGPGSRDVSGAVVERRWDGATGEHVYTITVPRLYEDEDPEYITVREYEILGLVGSSADDEGDE
jgi:hypothetical protein